MKRMMAGTLLLLAAGAAAQDDGRAAAFRDRVAYLASDDMRGREAGSPDYDRAAAWLATRFAAVGLRPAGPDGFLQPVPLVSATPADQGQVALIAAGTTRPLAFGADYLPEVDPNRAVVAIDAPMVFAGYGVSAPAQGHDDYAGLDVRGKVVVVFGGAPKAMQGEVRAHFGNGITKRAEAARRGAVAVLTLYSPTQEAVTPFARRVPSWNAARMAWRTPAGTGFDPGRIPGAGTLSEAGAAKLLGAQAAALRAAETAGRPFPAVSLPSRLRVRYANRLGRAESSNVVGLIPGSDPRLRDEYVVLTAHLDHVGVGTPVNRDAIYNGAMDNAAGIATLLGVAERFGAAGAPRRSVLLVAVTAEEKGLVGSDYFARHPVRPRRSLVANVNLDMPVLLYDFTDMVAFGADRSTLGPIVRAALRPLGIASTPDPDPQEGIFTRSDHYRFVQQGVPSVALKPGPANGGAAADRDFRRNHYHQPSDDLSLPIRWTQGVRFVDANYAIARMVADAPDRPRWNRGDFFGTLYKGPMATR